MRYPTPVLDLIMGQRPTLARLKANGIIEFLNSPNYKNVTITYNYNSQRKASDVCVNGKKIESDYIPRVDSHLSTPGRRVIPPQRVPYWVNTTKH